MINGWKTGFLANGGLLSMQPEKMCETLKNIGYDAVELSADWLMQFSDARLKEIFKAVSDMGMIVSEVGAQKDYVTHTTEEHRIAIDETIQHMQRMADAGVGILNVTTGPRPWIANRVIVGEHVTQSEAWNMVFDAFDRIVPLAEKLGVTLALENVWGMACHDFFTTQFLVKRYNSPNFGVNFDPSHDQLAGNSDMEFLIRQWGRDGIKHIHMKDAAGSQERGRVLFPPLCAGLIDWEGFRRGIEAIGYDGVMSVEYEADHHLRMNLGGDWVRAAEESFRALTTILG